MSDVLSEYKSKSYQWKITITDPPLTYLMKQGISRFEIALAVKISYPLLQIWHQKVGDGYDYIDFFNASVARTWFQVSRVTGHRIQRRLEREAGVIANKYRQTKGRNRGKLNDQYLTVSILRTELVSFKHVLEELDLSRSEISEWKKKCTDLEAEKQKLVEEIREVLRKKEEERVDLEVATMELRNHVEQLGNQSGIACQCKKIREVDPKQRTRKLKLKGKG